MGKKYSYDDLRSEGWSDERIRSWNGWDRSEPGTGYMQNRAPEGSGAVDAWTAPSWWNESENGDWTGSQAASYHAWMSVLGRDPGSAYGIGLTSGMGYSAAVQALSLTPEARARGVDPLKFGNEILDPGELSADLKPYYDEWRKNNGDEPFFSGHEELLRWQKDFGSIDAYKAINDGTIESLGGAWKVTQAAVDKYGAENLRFTGHNAGDIIMVPKGSGIKVGYEKHGKTSASIFHAKAEGDEDPWTKKFEDEGYDVYATTGTVRAGIMDRVKDDLVDHLGMSEDVAAALMLRMSGGISVGDFLHDVAKIDEGYFMTDPGGFVSGWFYGDEGARHNLEGAASFLGMDKNDPDDMNQIARYQGYGSAAFTTALSFTGWGAGVSAALNAARQMGRAQVGQQDWGTAVGNTFVSLVASRLGGAYGGAYSGAYNAAVQASSSALQTAITNADSHTVDKQDIGTAAAVGALGGIAEGVSNAAGGAYNLGPLSQGFLNAAAQSAASYGGAYLSAWGNGGEVDSESAAFNAILAGASGFGKGYKIGKRNQKELATMVRYDNMVDALSMANAEAGGEFALTPEQAAALGPRPPQTLGERMSYEFGGLDENNEFSWFSNRRPGGKEPPMTAIQRAEQEFLGAVTPWATTYEIESMYGGNQRAAAPAAVKTPASVGKPSPWAPAQWPLVGGLFSTGGRHLSQGWNWATDAERAWIPG